MRPGHARRHALLSPVPRASTQQMPAAPMQQHLHFGVSRTPIPYNGAMYAGSTPQGHGYTSPGFAGHVSEHQNGYHHLSPSAMFGGTGPVNAGATPCSPSSCVGPAATRTTWCGSLAKNPQNSHSAAVHERRAPRRISSVFSPKCWCLRRPPPPCSPFRILGVPSESLKVSATFKSVMERFAGLLGLPRAGPEVRGRR